MIKDPVSTDISHISACGLNIPVQTSIKYLGVSINADMNRPNSIKARCDNTIRIMKALLPYLKKLKSPIEFLMKIYHVILVPSLLYGLKSSSLTQRNRRTLMKREIFILKDLSTVAYPKPPNTSFYKLLDGKTINRKVSAYRIRYFGHLQRRDETSLMRKAMRYKINKKRKVGRPLFTFNTTLLADMRKYADVTDWDWEDCNYIKNLTASLYEKESSDDDPLDSTLMLYGSDEE